MTSEPADRVRSLIRLDATNVLRRLAERQDEMITLFSRLRDREALTGTLHSWFETVRFEDLALLGVPEQHAVNHFYERLGELRWYFRYTVDMPGSAAVVFKGHLHRLAEAHETLAALLGGEERTKALPGPPAPRKRRGKVAAATGRKRRPGRAR